jgi:hypothetical protein
MNEVFGYQMNEVFGYQMGVKGSYRDLAYCLGRRGQRSI